MSLEKVYSEIQPRIYAFFFVKTANKEIAEDLTQEVFYEAIKGFHTFSGHSSIQTWLFSIARNRLNKYFRKKKYRNKLADLLKSQDQYSIPLEESYIDKEEKNLLITQINKLDELSKEIITLRIYGELSVKEIAYILGKSESYIRVTFHRAKLKIQKELEDYNE